MVEPVPIREAPELLVEKLFDIRGYKGALPAEKADLLRQVAVLVRSDSRLANFRADFMYRMIALAPRNDPTDIRVLYLLSVPEPDE